MLIERDWTIAVFRLGEAAIGCVLLLAAILPAAGRPAPGRNR
jgi:hypothetical protein